MSIYLQKKLMPLLGLSWIVGDSQKRGFARLDVLGSLCSHGALAKIRYALALNGNARNHNEKRIVGTVRSAFAKQNTKTRLLPTPKLSTFPLILARLSLCSCLCSGCLGLLATRKSVVLLVWTCWVRFAHAAHLPKSAKENDSFAKVVGKSIGKRKKGKENLFRISRKF